MNHLADELATSGLALTRDHMTERARLGRLVRSGEIVRVLPGAFLRADLADDSTARIVAAARWAPDAVVTGMAAARLSFWPNAQVPIIELASARQFSPIPGFRFERRTIPPEHTQVRHGVRLTTPAFTAVDLASVDEGRCIDTALRARGATVDLLNEALSAQYRRRGTQARRRVVLRSRTEPWSALERATHRLLDDAGISGWVANHPVCLEGHWLYLDLWFAKSGLVIELDGRAFHSSPHDFERDRFRQNLIVLHGWQILRFTARMISDDPAGVLAQIRTALALCKNSHSMASSGPA